MDASYFPGTMSFTVEMVVRDWRGQFMEGRNLRLPNPGSVLEAEGVGVREALSWLLMRGVNCEVVVETDSLLTASAINGFKEYRLEFGNVVAECKSILQQTPWISVAHIRKQANQVAHSLARVPCLENCCNIFSSPPTHLAEKLMYDILMK